MSEKDFYDEEYFEGQPNESCPKCGRDYDDIEFDFQWCSKCGWDDAKQEWGEKREPTDEDIMNGDWSILDADWR